MNLIWHKQVPLKVSILSWRLLRDTLPTKSNLTIHGVIPVEAQLCVAGCGHVEDAQHLFLTCTSLASIWLLVQAWSYTFILINF